MSTADDTDALDVLRLLGHLYLRQGRAVDAVVVLRALRVLAPHDHAAALALASALIRCGKAGAALELLDAEQDAGSTSAALYLLRAQALAADGQPEPATQAARRFNSLRGDPTPLTH